MKKQIDINTWNRKDHFNFFIQFEEPFFGVTVEINCSKAYRKVKEKNYSFFLYYLHTSLVAANSIEAFRYRIHDGEVFIYDQINASPTINRENGPFGFSYMNYEEDFEDFAIGAKKEIERVRSTTGLMPAVTGENLIHYSSLPWLNFSSFSHARSYSFPDSCPKISFGQMYEKNGEKFMPVSIHVHHALMDGYEVGIFVDKFQNLMNG